MASHNIADCLLTGFADLALLLGKTRTDNDGRADAAHGARFECYANMDRRNRDDGEIDCLGQRLNRWVTGQAAYL